MTEETLNDYVNKIQSFNMNEDKRFDAVHIKDAVMAGYNICRSECEKGDLEVAIRIGALEKENAELKKEIEELKKTYRKQRNKRIDELQKKNAELENNFRICEKNADTYYDRLTKAIEIIEGLMRFCRCFAQHHTEDIRYKEAEQFIKDSEVE